MTQPPAPIRLDEIPVVVFAYVDGELNQSSNPRYVTSLNEAIPPAERIAIGRNERDEVFVLFLCDSDWKVLISFQCDSLDEAKSMAERDYRGLQTSWVEMKQ